MGKVDQDVITLSDEARVSMICIKNDVLDMAYMPGFLTPSMYEVLKVNGKKFKHGSQCTLACWMVSVKVGVDNIKVLFFTLV